MQRERSSFRDNSGFVFYSHDSVYRAVNRSYQSTYDQLASSGLYESLMKGHRLITHKEVEQDQWAQIIERNDSEDIYRILEAERIPFISYPYEWCFQQLKDAAILTLDIQLAALEHGMTLKDASAYNIQFASGKPVFIDSLSFEPYEEGQPWVAYRQFCKHFLAPLSLTALVNTDLRTLSQLYIDGVPLKLASDLLPWKTRLSPFYQLHLHYHAKLETKYAGNTVSISKQRLKLSMNKLVAIIGHLKSGVSSIQLPSHKTEWSNYYQECTYSDEAIEHKRILVADWARELKPSITYDMGCNTGVFSEAVLPFSKHVVAFDLDHLAIEMLYAKCRKNDIQGILPLVLDLANPSPAIGWANEERKSILERSSADLVLALALLHHLAIGNNLPFEKIAEYFASITNKLVIEFVPKDDVQLQRLLVTRKDIFESYTQDDFERIFGERFNILRKEGIKGTERTLYFMSKK